MNIKSGTISFTLDRIVIILGGCDAGAVVVDCTHQMKTEQIAALLQIRVRKIAENHYRSGLPLQIKIRNNT